MAAPLVQCTQHLFAALRSVPFPFCIKVVFVLRQYTNIHFYILSKYYCYIFCSWVLYLGTSLSIISTRDISNKLEQEFDSYLILSNNIFSGASQCRVFNGKLLLSHVTYALPCWVVTVFGAIQVLRNAVGGGGVSASPEKSVTKTCVRFNIINVTRGWMGG